MNSERSGKDYEKNKSKWDKKKKISCIWERKGCVKYYKFHMRKCRKENDH